MALNRTSKIALALIPAAVFVALITFATIESDRLPEPGDPAPAFEAALLEGSGTLALADLDGKPAVLNFWASWCGPCVDEAPMLKKAYETYGDEVEFVGIDIRDARSDAIEFIEKYDLDYHQVRDESLSIHDDYGLTGQPETFFIDEEGVIVEHVKGPLTEESLFALLDILVSRNG